MRTIYSPTISVMVSTAIEPQVLIRWITDHEIEMTGPIHALVDAVVHGRQTLDHIVEFAGRQCYRSWNAGREHGDYIRHILMERHGNVLEHAALGLTITGVSRSLSHELVRHHTGFSVSQESQRFVDMKDAEFVIPPALIDMGILEGVFDVPVDVVASFEADCRHDLERYLWWQEFLKKAEVKGKKNINQAARFKLPNATATRMHTTINLRELRNILEQRGSEGADPEIRRLALAILNAVRPYAPHSFYDFQARPVPGVIGSVLYCDHSKV